MSTEQDTNVVTVLTRDHREVEEIFSELERLGESDPERRGELTEKVITELVRHSVAEEAYLYPAVRDLVPGGDQLADRELAEHAEAERTMKELEQVDATDSRHAALLAQLMAEVRAHVQEEESELFPLLSSHATASQLAEMGHKVQAVKTIAPTRPHPAAPDTPPANKLVAPLVGLVDRVRDAITGRGRS
ncbi:hemerythrin domain-containing protein [Streptosporangium sp. NPDC000396]|uniref:hemerythrin domain-containing protein n=1 Tax=Streptosporangium sp. NPDC000396 TaxID=3366185 RepID=UPI0036BBF8EC